MKISAMGLESSLGPQLQQPDETMKDILGSGSVKQERPGSEEDAQKSSKIPRTDDDLNLLCFSLQDKWGGLGLFGGLRPQNTTALPAYYSFASGAFNSNVHAPFTGVRSPFTPTQWVELELQALIYKHLVAKMPVPSSLLLPIKKSFYPYGSSGSSAGTLTSNSMGWGPFHQGLGRKSDPEPGRCRRTDGKKWRCSRDAVPEQKYCDRHINRGRHRSRKHVEGQQPGYSLSGFSNTKMAPMATQIISSGGAASGHSSAPHQFQASHYIASGIPSPSAFISGIGDCQSLSALSSDFSLSPRNASFYTIGEQNPIMELPQYDFQFLSDSLINPSQQTPSYISSTSSYNALMEFSDQEANDQFPFFQLFEDWPKDQSNCSTISWPEELKSDWNPLSVSTSMKSDFSSSSFSPVYEKASLSPLRLSYDFDPIQMNSIANNDFSELFQKPKKSVPASCASSMGDPLGEVLKICDSKFKSCYGSPSSLNAVKEWDGANRNMKFSPTSVLQYAPLCSLSNSSSASSPRDGNKKTPEGGSHCEDVMASNVVCSSPFLQM